MILFMSNDVSFILKQHAVKVFSLLLHQVAVEIVVYIVVNMFLWYWYDIYKWYDINDIKMI